MSKDYLDARYLNIVQTQDAGGEDDGEDGEPVARLAVARVDVAWAGDTVYRCWTRLLSYGRVFNVVVSLRSCGRDQGDTEISIYLYLDIQVGAVGEHKVCLPRDLRNSRNGCAFTACGLGDVSK